MNIQFHKLKTHSEEWHEFRNNHIGGSEGGTIFNPLSDKIINPYDSCVRLWAEKVGLIPRKTFENEFMFHGTNLEDYIAKLWQYYEGDSETLIDNYNNNNIQRKCRDIKATATNKKYPWLHANIDRLINNNQFKISDGKPLAGRGILELKTMSGYVYKVWDTGVPDMYIIQVHIYMIVYELDYAEIAILKDGRSFECFGIERNENLCNLILKVTKDFWYNKVVPARDLLRLRDGSNNDSDYDKYDGMLHELEPDIDSTNSAKEFISNSFKKDVEEILGDVKHYNLGLKQKKITEIIKVLNDRKDLLTNKLAKIFRDYNVERINFDNTNEYMRYYKKSNSDNHIVDNRTKYPMSDKEIKDIIKALDI